MSAAKSGFLSLAQCGFLSPDFAPSIANIRIDFAPWFALGESYNDLAMRVLPRITADNASSEQLLVAALFGRTVTSYQAACILIERGMLADARTVVRAAAETTIVMRAVVADPSVCDLLVDRHFWHHRKLRVAWLANPQAVAYSTPEQITAIEAAIADADAEHPPGKTSHDPVNVADLARRGDATALYDTVYRATSGDAAHTTLDALNRQVGSKANGDIRSLGSGQMSLIFRPPSTMPFQCWATRSTPSSRSFRFRSFRAN